MFEVDLAERARHLLSIVRDALQAPGEDPVVTVVVVAIFALVAMVLAVIAIIVYVELRPATSRPAVQVLKRRSHVARTTAQSVGWTLVAIGVIVAAGVGLRVANAPPTCARCHTGPPEALERTVHASVACGKCHTRPGLTGSIERQISYAREVAVHIVGLRRTETPDPDGLPAVRSPSTAYPGPSSSSCLRCHRSVLRGVVVSAGVRME
ncbi:MAG: NapC/NirT family cytochrome c, partial [Coriobacteriia bacterium]|nr:NapC/NirT family cytochrome c [Coriobacteriia bacterium]